MGSRSKSSTSRTQNTNYDYWTDQSQDNSVDTDIDNSYRDNSRVNLEATEGSYNTTTDSSTSETNITVTDGGAVDAMGVVSLGALEFGEGAFDTFSEKMESIARTSIESGERTSARNMEMAYENARHSVDTVSGSLSEGYSNALDKVSGNSIEFARLLGESYGEANDEMGETFTKALTFADAQSRSEGARLAENFQKTLLWGAGIAAAAIVVPRVLK